MEKKENGIYRIALNGAEVTLKKDFMGFRVVYPIRNVDGSINWKNLLLGGSWYRLAITIFLLFVIFGFFQEYVNHLNLLTKCLTALNDSVIIFNP